MVQVSDVKVKQGYNFLIFHRSYLIYLGVLNTLFGRHEYQLRPVFKVMHTF